MINRCKKILEQYEDLTTGCQIGEVVCRTVYTIPIGEHLIPANTFFDVDLASRVDEGRAVLREIKYPSFTYGQGYEFSLPISEFEKFMTGVDIQE